MLLPDIHIVMLIFCLVDNERASVRINDFGNIHAKSIKAFSSDFKLSDHGAIKTSLFLGPLALLTQLQRFSM